MLFLTRWFGVTCSDAERNAFQEQSDIKEIIEKVLLMQTQAATRQHQPLRRGTHAKGICARAEFEVLDIAAGHGHELAARLLKGIFAKPGKYPSVVRFGNSDARSQSDFKPDVRSLSFSVDLTGNGMADPAASGTRQDFSLQNTRTLPINDAPAFLAIIKMLTASNPAAGMWSLPFKDKLRVLRTLALLQPQTHQRVKPYQQMHYGSNVPFRHGPIDVVKFFAKPAHDNPAHPLKRSNPNALQDELARHLKEDDKMSSFNFGVQFLDVDRMTYWGKRRDASFWIENASVNWKEAEAPFHTIARLTLLSNSQLQPEAAESAYIDVTGNSTPDSRPLGSINRARWPAEVASRKARMRAANEALSITADRKLA